MRNVQALIPAIAELAGGWLKGKAEKAAVSRVKVAKAEAEVKVMRGLEAGWEKVMAEASKDSWKDETWTILFIAIIAMCFIPPLQPYVQRGFDALSRHRTGSSGPCTPHSRTGCALKGLKK